MHLFETTGGATEKDKKKSTPKLCITRFVENGCNYTNGEIIPQIMNLHGMLKLGEILGIVVGKRLEVPSS